MLGIPLLSRVRNQTYLRQVEVAARVAVGLRALSVLPNFTLASERAGKRIGK